MSLREMIDVVYVLVPVDTDGRPTNFPIAIFDEQGEAEHMLNQLTGDFVIAAYKWGK